MTAQEIDRIECAIRHIKTSVDVDPWAMEIAVDAMQKQIPKKTQKDLQPTCNNLATDCISRQAAIDALIAEGRNVDGKYIESERIILESDAVEAISMLPSAQPEPCDDAVSRQAVINIINKPVIIKAREQIEALPSVQPEIIHCKDCYNYPGEHTDCPLIGWGRNENDFCSRPERRTDEL